CTLQPIALRGFCIGMNCLYCTMGRSDFTVPPMPLISPPRKRLCPVLGAYGLSIELNEKLGTILLVMIPVSEFGPEIPRKARFWKRILDASLTATSEDRSSE